MAYPSRSTSSQVQRPLRTEAPVQSPSRSRPRERKLPPTVHSHLQSFPAQSSPAPPPTHLLQTAQAIRTAYSPASKLQPAALPPLLLREWLRLASTCDPPRHSP